MSETLKSQTRLAYRQSWSTLSNAATLFSDTLPGYHIILGGWIAKWVASSGRLQRSRVRIPVGAKVLGTDGICKYLPVSVSSYVEVCLCLLCPVCIN